MLTASELVNALARNFEIIKSQTEGLTQADTLLQPPFGGNCLNWALGHIAEYRDNFLTTLGRPALLGDQGSRYRRGSAPVTGAEEATLPLSALLAGIGQAQEQLAAALGGMDEAALAAAITVGERQTTVGRRLFFLYFHETYHVGQLEIYRNLAGKHDPII